MSGDEDSLSEISDLYDGAIEGAKLVGDKIVDKPRA